MQLRKLKEIFALPVALPFFMAGMILLLHSMAYAEAVKYPVSCYTPAELAKVREWEKSWAGKKIDHTNIDQVSEFMLKGAISWYKDFVKWGSLEDSPPYFYIDPYKQYVETKGMIAATLKYAPTNKIDDAGNLMNYADIAGVPFPDPKTGLEIAWNFDVSSKGDVVNYYRDGNNIEPGERYERVSRADYTKMYLIHRTDVEPRPKALKNPKGVHHGQFMHMYDPPENKNSRFFNIRYSDHTKKDDGYIYYSPFRRLRRMGAAIRTDSIDGTEMIYDDGDGYDGHIQQNTYKYIGKKELLLTRHDDYRKWKRIPGQAVPDGIHRQRSNFLVVEVFNKDPNYLYGKRVWYIDPECYWIPWQEIYDQLGRYWKCNEYQFDIITTLKGEPKMIPGGSQHSDLQRFHGGHSTDDFLDKPGMGIGRTDLDFFNIFTVRNLQKGGY